MTLITAVAVSRYPSAVRTSSDHLSVFMVPCILESISEYTVMNILSGQTSFGQSHMIGIRQGFTQKLPSSKRRRTHGRHGQIVSLQSLPLTDLLTASAVQPSRSVFRLILSV